MRISPIKNYSQNKNVAFGMYATKAARNVGREILSAKTRYEYPLQNAYDRIQEIIENCPFIKVNVNSKQDLIPKADIKLLEKHELWGSIQNFENLEKCKTPQELSMLATCIKEVEDCIPKEDLKKLYVFA